MQPPFPGIVLYLVTRNIPKSSYVLLMSGELVLSVDCYVRSCLIYTVFSTRPTFFQTQKYKKFLSEKNDSFCYTGQGLNQLGSGFIAYLAEEFDCYVHPRSFSDLFLIYLNHTFFTQGECWAGNSNQDDHAKHGSVEKGCIEQDYKSCQSDCCMGGHNRNMVYQICKYNF